MRHRLPTVSLAALALLVLSACSIVNGSGRVATETRQVSGFSKIDLSGAGEVTIEQGGTEALTIEADDNVLPKLTGKVSGDTLKLGKRTGTALHTKNPIRYRVTLKDLTGLDVSGSGTVQAQQLKLQAVHVDISGSGAVNLSGTAVEQHVEVSGSGRYDAAEMPSDKVSVDISGSGQASLAVNRELKIDISGSGTVTYTGNPSVDQSVSGSGRVIKK
jgi:Putative auto-transporter adhesin, head GIN domain